MDELIGKSFGPYTIVSKLGEGGMAVVYKGFQESLNRYVAIKVLRSELARMKRWTGLQDIAPAGSEHGPSRASFVASTLSAGLELVKEGALEARQLEHFAEIYLRARTLEAAE